MFYRIVINESGGGDVDVTDEAGFEPRARRLRNMNRNPRSLGYSSYIVKSNQLSGTTNFLVKE